MVFVVDVFEVLDTPFSWCESVFSSTSDSELNAPPKMVYRSTEIPKDEEKAYFYARQAAAKNDGFGCFLMGAFYENGIQCEQNYYKSFEYYDRGLKQNDKDCMCAAGKYLMKGIGCTQDIEKARAYLETAAEQGDIDAAMYLVDLFTAEKYGLTNREKAYKYGKICADAGKDNVMPFLKKHESEFKKSDAIRKQQKREEDARKREIEKKQIEASNREKKNKEDFLAFVESLGNNINAKILIYLGSKEEPMGFGKIKWKYNEKINAKIVGFTTDDMEFLELFYIHMPDIIIFDVDFDNQNVIRILSEINNKPDVKKIVVSRSINATDTAMPDHATREYVENCKTQKINYIQSGANYIVEKKEEYYSELLNKIEQIAVNLPEKIKNPVQQKTKSNVAKIMVWTNTSFMQMLLEDIITKAGHEVVCMPRSHLELYKNYFFEKPDIVILDMFIKTEDERAEENALFNCNKAIDNLKKNESRCKNYYKIFWQNI